MTLQFYLGRAGSGKTQRCLDDIAERLREDPTPRGAPLIWLLPEQATAEAEAALLRAPGVRGYARAHVLSFRRLAWTVLRETGGTAQDFLDDQGRLMMLRALVARHRDQLRVFARSARETGFVSRLAATLTELAQFRHSFDDLEAFAKRLEAEGRGDSALAGKLRDIALLGRAWKAQLGERFADPDCFLDELARRLRQSRLFDGAEVWIDGFASFMPQEMKVLEEIFQPARTVHVALLLEPRDLHLGDGERAGGSETPPPADPARLFSQTEETHLRLAGLAADLGTEVADPVCFPLPSQPTRFTDAPALESLESRLRDSAMMPAGRVKPAGRAMPAGKRDPRNVEGIGVAPCPPAPLPPIVCAEAAGRREEVEAVARVIRRLCREEGSRYRDLAVILRDLDIYHPLIRSIFARHEIPYFIDRRRSIAHHPLVELVRSALRVVTKNWSPEDVIHYLKTDFAPVDRFEADEVENCVLERGVRGRRWWTDRTWQSRSGKRARTESAEPPGEEPPGAGSAAQTGQDGGKARSLDEIRALALAPLVSLEEQLTRSPGELDARTPSAPRTISPALSPPALVQAVEDFLDRLECGTKIRTWAMEERARGAFEKAEEHEQTWSEAMALLEQTAMALGEDPVPVEDFADILESGLAGLTLGLAPPSLDQVLVGTIERSRQPNLQTVFVLGMNEGIFPRIAAE
ncbi:MAG TPA: hypothetical protein VM492_05595, partial [Sumerlaeia bacterium]|nr:hypothetical protein [Sumerlaeia bacterium]